MVALTQSVSEVVIQRFAQLLQRGRLAHAYILVGPAGVGKTQTARAIAKLVNCDKAGEGPCGLCPSCVKIDSGNHPDVETIEPGEQASITIEQVRAVLSRSHLKPFEARWKIFIIKDVEQISAEAANCLLKTLEEPAPSTLLILTATSCENVLDTIISRCHTVRLFPEAEGQLAGELTVALPLEEHQARILAVFAQGCRGRAFHLEREGFLQRKNEVIDQITLVEDNDLYLRNILSDKEKSREALQVLFSWLRDLLLLKREMPQEALVHQDRLLELKKAAAFFTFHELSELIREVVRAAQLLKENFNVRIALLIMREKLWKR